MRINNENDGWWSRPQVLLVVVFHKAHSVENAPTPEVPSRKSCFHEHTARLLAEEEMVFFWFQSVRPELRTLRSLFPAAENYLFWVF